MVADQFMYINILVSWDAIPVCMTVTKPDKNCGARKHHLKNNLNELFNEVQYLHKHSIQLVEAP